MDTSQEAKLSKFLSLVLRHSPQTIGLTLDSAGWVDTEELLAQCNRHGTRLNREMLETVVKNSDKQRFAFNEDCSRIRANQGHSVSVELGYQPSIPPAILYHGTAIKNLESIRKSGLIKGKRHHVHLSATSETAQKVGSRHGKPMVLVVKAVEMHADGISFFCSENGVWLTDSVPVKYLVFNV
jgi:putative RNA 2'-phosphotransferase